MSLNYTNGEWSLSVWSEHSTAKTGGPAGIYVDDDDEGELAICDFPAFPEVEETEANAKLIAAAPEMYERLKFEQASGNPCKILAALLAKIEGDQ